MPLTGATQFSERIQFFNGQRLFASDLQALEEFNRQMRWLHIQSLHQPGVGSGFAISGKKGDREVTIQPGYAVDSLGREIVLTETEVQPVPPVANDGFGNSAFFDLTVAYPEDSELQEAETREGICLPRGVVRLRELPVFCWIELGPAPDFIPKDATLGQQVQNGLRIRLARAQVLNCQLERPLSTAQRRNARPAAQPYIACGSTSEKQWDEPKSTLFGIELHQTVSTASAQFQTVPCYMAHILGERQFHFTISGRAFDLLLDGFTNITQPAEDHFDITVLLPETLMEISGTSVKDEVAKALPAKLIENQWRVEWVGIEV